MNLRPLVYLFVYLLVFPVCAQDAAVSLIQVPPEAVGVSESRLDRMHALAKSYVDDKKTAGVLTMVARKGEVIHFDVYGKQDIENNIDLKHNSIFRIYSMTKPVTNVAAMMLYEEGHFQLDDPVHKHLPVFEDLMVYDAEAPDGSNRVKPDKPMTIRHLMTHTSGFTYGVFGDTPVDKMYREKQVLNLNAGLETMAERLSEIPLMHHPGERWTYGVSTDVLGYLVEELSGMALGDFLQTRIFNPLGMTDTAFYVPEDKVDRFAKNYTYGPDGSLIVQDGGATSPYLNPERVPSGGAGLVSTASDYMRFAQMMLNGGQLNGVRLLSPKTVELMTLSHTDENYQPGRGFGLGFSVVTDVAETQILGSKGTFWWSGLANTYFYIDPKEELIAMVWTQLFSNGPFGLQDDFHIGVYQSLVETY